MASVGVPSGIWTKRAPSFPSTSTVAPRSAHGSSVGLFGSLEVRQYRGPLRAGVDYVGRTKILRLTESPKAENVWYDVVIADPVTGDDVGCVQFVIRLMKASSDLWADAARA